MAKKLRGSIKYIVTILICIVFLVPIVWSLSCSLKPEADIVSYPPKWIPDVVTFSNYIQVLEKYPYLSWAKNSIITSVAGTGLILVLSSLAAYAFGRFQFRGKKLLYSVVVAMLLIPIQAYMIPLFLLYLCGNHFAVRSKRNQYFYLNQLFQRAAGRAGGGGAY